MNKRRSSIVAILNLHREGELGRASCLSALEAVTHAKRNGFDASMLAILDRPDTATIELVKGLQKQHSFQWQEVDYGDLSMSRNHGVDETSADFVGFLDGDDLWSTNWLTASATFCHEKGPTTICHPKWNVIFGADQRHFIHMDQTSRAYQVSNLRYENSWTALSFASRAIYKSIRYRSNRLQDGFGYEDWSWNCETIASGYLHWAVPETSHFIRYKKTDSLRMETNARSCLMSPSSLFQVSGHA